MGRINAQTIKPTKQQAGHKRAVGKIEKRKNKKQARMKNEIRT